MPPHAIFWRVHFSSSRQKVFEALSTDRGRRTFWAEQAPEIDGFVHFKFSNGAELQSRVLEARPPELFRVEYFGGSQVRFELADDGTGGTDLTMTEAGIPAENLLIHLPGWIPVLLALKAAVDFSVDLRNHDPARTWERGYVDV
jgi:uncharacterized protein YndB with AHSA1/START domain